MRWLTIVILALGAMTSTAAQPPAGKERARLAQASTTGISVFHLEGTGGALLFLGTVHTGDPTNPQLDDIAQLWTKFEPTLLLNEGGEPAHPFKSREDAVRAFGEMGFARFLAGNQGLIARSADAPLADEVNEMVKHHSPGEVKCFYLLRMVPTIARKVGGEPLDDGIVRFLTQLNTLPTMAGRPNTIDEIDEVCSPFSGGIRWREATLATTMPTASLGPLNEVAKSSSSFRDAHMAREIVDAVRSGERVLVVAGAAHLQAQRPRILKALMTGQPVGDS